MRRRLAVAALVLAAAAAAGAAVVLRGGAEEPGPDLEAVLAPLVTGPDRVAPGGVAFLRTPEGDWSAALGVADAVTGEPMPVDARMRLESVSKMWTAAVVLRLVEDGVLRPADTVERWLPDLLPYGDRITVEQLLTHTSGLIDNNDMVKGPESFIGRVEDEVLRAELLGVVALLRRDPAATYPPTLWVQLAAWQPLLFEPGTTYHYSNIGFEVLGLIASRASGRSLDELFRDVIIEPLGLESAAYDPQGPIRGPHPRGYAIDADTGALTDTTDSHGGIGAEGGIVADAADTAGFVQALMRGEVIAPALAERMRGDLFWTQPSATGCGPAYGHGGAGAGFRTEVLASADGERVAVLLLNGRAGSSGDAAGVRAIARLFCAR